MGQLDDIIVAVLVFRAVHCFDADGRVLVRKDPVRVSRRITESEEMTISEEMPADTAESELTDSVSKAMVHLYAEAYGHDRTTAKAYINDNVVVCILEDILSVGETGDIADGESSDVIDERVAFQNRSEDKFTNAVEHLTGRTVTAFLSANQTSPGVACEMFFLEETLQTENST